MTETVVVNRRAGEYDISIARPSQFGNSFIVGKDGDRATVIAKYKTWFWKKVNEPEFLKAVLALHGKRLGCWCKPLACHGDVIVDFLRWLETDAGLAWLTRSDVNTKPDVPAVIDSFRYDYFFLSNFFVRSIILFGIKFASSEHAYQWCKVRAGQDTTEHYRAAIIAAPTPRDAKRIGNDPNLPLQLNWNSDFYNAMKLVVMAKFTQHGDLARMLLNTSPALLIEKNKWHDNRYGWCVCTKCENEPHFNHLGHILEETRMALSAFWP